MAPAQRSRGLSATLRRAAETHSPSFAASDAGSEANNVSGMILDNDEHSDGSLWFDQRPRRPVGEVAYQTQDETDSDGSLPSRPSNSSPAEQAPLSSPLDADLSSSLESRGQEHSEGDDSDSLPSRNASISDQLSATHTSGKAVDVTDDSSDSLPSRSSPGPARAISGAPQGHSSASDSSSLPSLPRPSRGDSSQYAHDVENSTLSAPIQSQYTHSVQASPPEMHFTSTGDSRGTAKQRPNDTAHPLTSGDVSDLLPEFSMALNTALRAENLSPAALKDAINQFSRRHERQLHFDLLSSTPEILYNPAIRQVEPRSSAAGEPAGDSRADTNSKHIMHEDALFSLNRQLKEHQWASVVTHLELIGSAHGDVTKHISFLHEIFESTDSTRSSMADALSSIDDVLNRPPFST